MGQFYIDDSVHDKSGFIIGACVYTNENPNEQIIQIIESCGFNPDKFEYKSRANYSNEPQKMRVRELLRDYLRESCKLGIVIIPREHRNILGFECLEAIEQFIKLNNNIETPLRVYFDQGMFNSKAKANEIINSLNLTDCSFYLEQNSADIRGIQLADLAAHISSIQLKYALGLVSKVVKARENSGYDPESEIELGFEMWATIRHVFFAQMDKPFTDDLIASLTVDVEPYGLYISNLCDEKLKDAARKQFGSIYLGCIH